MTEKDMFNFLAETLGDNQRNLNNANKINIILGIALILSIIFCIFFELHLI